ncbi:sterile alpha motif domain-containing protein 9-like [Littorina saxatilis]|uniref:CARD domain-containing protein n=1 Tax=Littorina saxatilis TaxID=31220 RepID=A0AAN9GBM1_9CAEN
MRDSEYKKIQAQFEPLVKELDLDNTGIIEFLFSKEILTEEDKDDLSRRPTSHEKNRHFLKILRTKEDAAYGLLIFALEKYQSHLVEYLQLPGIPRRKAKSSSGSGVGKGFEDFTTAELQEWLKPRLEKEGIPATVIEKVAEEEIDGKVFMYMTESDMKDEFSDLKFGPRKKLFLLKNEVMETTTPFHVDARPLLPRQERTEHAREFGCKPQSSEKYIQTKILNQHEARSSASFLDPVRQFFPCSDDEERENIYDFMAEKVAVFSAACLNDRRNGTVHFGIGNADCQDFHYGEVLGLPLEQKECEDTMVNFIRKRFSSEAAADAALKCINVFFVEVVLRDREEPATHFVCEVDVEPKSEVVQNLAFFVDLNRDASSGKQVLFRFDNRVPTQQDQAGVVKFTEEKESLTNERQQQEKTPTTRAQNLPQLLKNFLCGGGDKLDGSYVHLLATGAVDFTQTDIEESFKFISSVDWRGIFDFDVKSADHGLYQFLDEKEEMLYKVKTVENFCASPTADTGGQSSLDELFQDMDESELKTWIFCNGYQGTEEEELNITQWKKKRSAGFKEVVRYFRNSIPDERGVIIILVTTKDDVFIEACEELLLSFQNQWVMIAESKQLAEAWIDGLQKRNVEVDSSRCLSNFSFAEVSKAIQQLKGAEAYTSNVCVVKSSAGLEEEVPKKKVQELCDLEIVSATECKVDDNEVDLDAVSKQHEEEFFKGNRATWWNFYCPGHVCPRDKLDDLKRQTREVLDGDDASDGDNIGFVEIYHQPGAGGTTVAMNVVWDLHTEFKSCVIKRITKDTASQILTLYELGERNPFQTKPVLVMLDNEDEGIDVLKRRIEDECQTRDINKLVCVFLICWRRMTLPPDHQARNILLEQKLSTREKRFFVDKYEELKKKGKENVDNLLGLNIMKEDFNEDYIKRTVAKFIELHTLHDRTILLYTAILNCYDLFFRGIPVACFDLVMRSTFQHCRFNPWEYMLPETPLMLFFQNTKFYGRSKCLRITSQLLCKYILDELCAGEKSHEDLMEEFLMSPTFKRQSGDFAVKELLNIVKDCLKKRGMASNGKKRCKFSPFIQMLVDEEKIEEATRCIQLVYERQEDAFLAQQVARVYITVKNWDKAEEWAGKATQKLPNNSFLWDTRGQICRSRLAEIRAECETSLGAVDASQIATAVEYAHEGSKFFERVDELSKKEKNDPPNTSGLFGQMEIAVVLCAILKHLPYFASKDDLIQFFSGQKELPRALQNTKVQNYVLWLRSLQEKAFGCLKSIEDQMMLHTSDLGLTYTSSKFFLSRSNIHSFEERLNNAFGEDDSSGTADPKQLSPEKRRRLMRKLGGNSLFSVISKCQQEEDGQDRARRIWQFASLTLEEAAAGQRSMSRTDLSMALASALTLISCHDDSFGERDYNKLLMWSTTLFEGTKNPEEEGHYINLDPYVYFFAFHWPASNRMNLSNLCKPDVLRKAMDRARSGFTKIGGRGGSSSRRNNPMFFLTKTKGLNCIIHKFHLQALSGRQTEKMVSKLLRHPKAIELVERFNGILMKNGQEVSTEVVQQGNKFILKVPLFVRESRQTLWNKKVYFALGIGPGGPVACDVSSDMPTPNHSGLTSGGSGDFRRPFLQRHPSCVMQIEAKITEVQQQLGGIRALKSNSQSRMTAAQAKRLQSEEAQLRKTLGQLQKERCEEEESIFL